MKKIKVDSSVISEMGYNSRAREVEITLKSGDTYKYKSVPSIDYYALLRAESHGKEFNNFKQRYDYERVNPNFLFSTQIEAPGSPNFQTPQELLDQVRKDTDRRD